MMNLLSLVEQNPRPLLKVKNLKAVKKIQMKKAARKLLRQNNLQLQRKPLRKKNHQSQVKSLRKKRKNQHLERDQELLPNKLLKQKRERQLKSRSLLKMKRAVMKKKAVLRNLLQEKHQMFLENKRMEERQKQLIVMKK